MFSLFVPLILDSIFLKAYNGYYYWAFFPVRAKPSPYLAIKNKVNDVFVEGWEKIVDNIKFIHTEAEVEIDFKKGHGSKVAKK